MKISSEFSAALFQTIQSALRIRDGRLVPGRHGGLISKDEAEKLALSSQRVLALCSLWWCLKEDGLSPFAETFGQVPTGDKEFLW